MTGWEGDAQGIVQEIEIWPYYQMINAQPKICPGEWDAQILWDFQIQIDHLILARRPDLVIVNKKREPAEWKLKKTKREIST